MFQEAAQRARLQAQLQIDIKAFQEKENNLRKHGERLRQLLDQTAAASVAHAPAPVAAARHPEAVALDAEWGKFQRSRALLEAERRAMIDERLLYKEQITFLQRRVVALRQRETGVTHRGKQLAEAAGNPSRPRRPNHP